MLPSAGSRDHYVLPAAESSCQSEDVEKVILELSRNDSIGDTAFSKAWVFSILIRILNTLTSKQASPQLIQEENRSINRPDAFGVTETDRCSEEGSVLTSRGVGEALSSVSDSCQSHTHEHIDVKSSDILAVDCGSDPSGGSQSLLLTSHLVEDFVDGETVLELEEELESQLCTMWDASMNEVSKNDIECIKRKT